MPRAASAIVIPFPSFPFSRQECEVIQKHLRERSPEICLDIPDPQVRDVIERFMEHI